MSSQQLITPKGKFFLGYFIVYLVMVFLTPVLVSLIPWIERSADFVGMSLFSLIFVSSAFMIFGFFINEQWRRY